jgi:Hemerythrin HHE cation binding domain
MEPHTACSALDAPIDGMYLIHKALRAEVQRVEEAVDDLETGGSFKPFQRAFYRWALAFHAHVESESQYLTPRCAALSLPQAQEGEQQQVLHMLEALQTYLHEDLGRMMVIPRTQRQLRGKVIALRIAQEDLLEEEEMAILPVLRHHLSAAAQWALIQQILLDEEAAEPSAVPDWMTPHLSDAEGQWLADLAARFQAALV